MFALLGLALAGLAAVSVALIVATREPTSLPPEEEEEAVLEEVIDAELREGLVIWAALADWRTVFTRWPNEWPADTDITFAWDIKNIGDTGAYFQVYLFTPGTWLYLAPGDRIVVYENFHTPAVPAMPSYQYYRINILGKKIDGERIGAVWDSEDIEITYV